MIKSSHTAYCRFQLRFLFLLYVSTKTAIDFWAVNQYTGLLTAGGITESYHVSVGQVNVLGKMCE